MPEPRIIKRYTNRKLYDTQSSQYVTLEQIALMIRQGEEVQVLDNSSKEDLIICASVTEVRSSLLLLSST